MIGWSDSEVDDVGAEVVEVRKVHATNTNEGYYACQ